MCLNFNQSVALFRYVSVRVWVDSLFSVKANEHIALTPWWLVQGSKNMHMSGGEPHW